MIRHLVSVLALCSLTLMAGQGAAEPLAPPAGEVVLTVSGKIERGNGPGGAAFDLAALKQFPARDIRTTTDWYEGMQHFTGVSATALLEALGAKGSELYAIAADGYEIEIPVAVVKEKGAILALEVNGGGFDPADRGPVWLIFPYDTIADADEREQYTAWSVWALQQIRVQN